MGRQVKVSIAVVVAMAIIGCTRQAMASEEEDVRAAMHRANAAWMRYDAHEVASLYTSDAIWQNPFGVRLQGNEAIEKFLTRLFQRPGYRSAKDTGKPTVTDVRLLAPGVATAWTEESSEGQIDDATGKPMAPRYSHTLEVLVKKDGVWKISEEIIMDEIAH